MHCFHPILSSKQDFFGITFCWIQEFEMKWPLNAPNRIENGPLLKAGTHILTPQNVILSNHIQWLWLFSLFLWSCMRTTQVFECPLPPSHFYIKYFKTLCNWFNHPWGTLIYFGGYASQDFQKSLPKLVSLELKFC